MRIMTATALAAISLRSARRVSCSHREPRPRPKMRRPNPAERTSAKISSIQAVDVKQLPEAVKKQVEEVVPKSSEEDLKALRASIDASPAAANAFTERAELGAGGGDQYRRWRADDVCEDGVGRVRRSAANTPPSVAATAAEKGGRASGRKPSHPQLYRTLIRANGCPGLSRHDVVRVLSASAFKGVSRLLKPTRQ